MARRYEYNPILNAYFEKSENTLVRERLQDHHAGLALHNDNISRLRDASSPAQREALLRVAQASHDRCARSARELRQLGVSDPPMPAPVQAPKAPASSPDLSRSFEAFRRAAVPGRTGGFAHPAPVPGGPSSMPRVAPKPVTGDRASSGSNGSGEGAMNASFDKQGYRRGPAKRAKIHDGHAEMDVPPHSATSGKKNVHHKVGHDEKGLPDDLRLSFRANGDVSKAVTRRRAGKVTIGGLVGAALRTGAETAGAYAGRAAGTAIGGAAGAAGYQYLTASPEEKAAMVERGRQRIGEYKTEASGAASKVRNQSSGFIDRVKEGARRLLGKSSTAPDWAYRNGKYDMSMDYSDYPRGDSPRPASSTPDQRVARQKRKERQSEVSTLYGQHRKLKRIIATAEPGSHDHQLALRLLPGHEQKMKDAGLKVAAEAPPKPPKEFVPITGKSLNYSRSSFRKSPRIAEDARRNPDGSRMTEEEFKLFQLGHRIEHKNKGYDELFSHYEGEPGGEGDVRREYPDDQFVAMAKEKQAKREERVAQTNKEEEERKMRKREKREMKRRQEQQESGEDQLQQSYADDANGVIITKAIANTDMIADMMRKSFGYTAEQIRDGLATVQPTAASPGAWHVGNEFEAHLDPVGGLILTRLGAGINPDNSMHIEGSASDLVKKQLEHAASMAKSFASRDERNGVHLGDPNYHYRQMIDSVIKAVDGMEAEHPGRNRKRFADRNQDYWDSKPDHENTRRPNDKKRDNKDSGNNQDDDPRSGRLTSAGTPDFESDNSESDDSEPRYKSLVAIYKSGDPNDEQDKKSAGKCPKCKTNLKPGAKECHKCGTAVRKKNK